jgi:hypothetical protein
LHCNHAPFTPEDKEEGSLKKLEDLRLHADSAAKLRYIGGSVIARIKYRTMKVLKSGSVTLGSKKGRKLKAKIDILEFISGHPSEVMTSTKYKDTLCEITERQYGLLTFLTDGCYEFFFEVECERLLNLTWGKLGDEGAKLPSKLLHEMCSCKKIGDLWLDMIKNVSVVSLYKEPTIYTYDGERTATKRYVKALLKSVILKAETISELKVQIIIKFMKSGTKSFKRHVNRKLAVKHGALRSTLPSKSKSKATTKPKKAKKRPSETVEEEEEGQCKYCGTDFSSSGMGWINCDGCGAWVDRACSQLGPKAWNIHQEDQSMFWFCTECVPFCTMCEGPLPVGSKYLVCSGCNNWICKACSGETSTGAWKISSSNDQWVCVNCVSLLLDGGEGN